MTDIDSATEADFGDLQAWVGRQESAEDTVEVQRINQLAASLDLPPSLRSGDILPLPWHWLLFPPTPGASSTGADGHPQKGGFLPPVQLPRRMWASSNVQVSTPLRVGEEVRRESTIMAVTPKQGSQGPLVFVEVAHDIFNAEGKCALSEKQHIVYREPARSPVTVAQPHSPEHPVQWERKVSPDPVLLFRYSALTFNGHRIHYDRNWATEDEGYPGLVVQGPLTATLLLDLMYQELGPVAVDSFRFRGVRPLFDLAAFRLQGIQTGDSVSLWALTPEGCLAMSVDLKLHKTS